MVDVVQLIVYNNNSIRKVAKDKGISKSVLSRYFKKYQNDLLFLLVPNYKHNQLFTVQEGYILVDYFLKSSKMFHGLRPKTFKRLPMKWHKLTKKICHINGLKISLLGQIG